MHNHDEPSTNITPFDFHGHEVRVITDDAGEPRWVAADVAAVLGLGRTHDMVRTLDEDERGTDTIRTPSGDQGMVTITESGLYSAILRSRKPEAKEFRRWVTGEVLPSIRKTGGYNATEMSRDELMARAVLFADSRIKELEATTQQQSEALATAAPKVEYHDRFVAADDDVMTISDWGAHYGLTRPQSFQRLVEAKIIYRKAITQEFSTKRGEVVDRNEYRPYSGYRNLFELRAQHNAPRYHNGQVRQTLYVKSVWAFSLAGQVGLEDLAGQELMPLP